MSISPQDLVPWLDAAAKAADATSVVVPGIGGAIASYLAAALKLAKDLAELGMDPVVHIERIHSADPLLKDVQNAWLEALRQKYGPEA